MLYNLSFFCSDTFDFFVKCDPNLFNEEIVDKSDYRPDSENTRAKRLTSFVPDSSSGVYDYDNGFTDDSPMVSPDVVALREGRLDKADIQRIKSELQDQANKDLADAKAKEALEEAEKVSKARTEYLDTLSGFTPPSE